MSNACGRGRSRTSQLLSEKRAKSGKARWSQSVGSRSPREMVGSARALALALAAFALATRAHIPSHDNILRIQLWDAEGLSREPITTEAPITTTKRTKKHNIKVNLDSLYHAMLEEEYGAEFGRFTRHKVRHKRRRPRQSGTDLPWKFHSGSVLRNVAVYDEDVPWEVIEGSRDVDSAVSDTSGTPVNETRDVSPPMTLRQDEEEVMSANTRQDNVSFQRYRRPRWLIAIHRTDSLPAWPQGILFTLPFQDTPRATMR